MARDMRKNRNSTNKELKEDPWTCRECKSVFTEPDAKLLECQRCRDHFCIRCLKKTKGEYDILSKSDSMWFCSSCRGVVEENISTGIKLEEMCDKLVQMFQSRMNVIEEKLDTKCDEAKVRDIVQEEISKVESKKTSFAEAVRSGPNTSPDKIEMTKVVVDEINDRKLRENNIIIFSIPENESEDKLERESYDLEQVKELYTDSI